MDMDTCMDIDGDHGVYSVRDSQVDVDTRATNYGRSGSFFTWYLFCSLALVGVRNLCCEGRCEYEDFEHAALALA